MRNYRPNFFQILCLFCLISGLAHAQANETSPSPTTTTPADGPDALSTPVAQTQAAPDVTSATKDSPSLMAPEAQPQIAFPLLKNYADFQLAKDEQFYRFGGWAVTIIGGLSFLGGATGLALYSENPTNNLADMTLQNSATLCLFGSVNLGFGLRDLIWPPTRDRSMEYRLVSSENDLVLREATAAATLKGWSDDARNRRTLAGFINIALAPVALGLSALLETSRGKPWYSGYSTNPAIPLLGAICVLNGGVSLLQTSPEEKLYQKYLAARDAVYSLPSQGR